MDISYARGGKTEIVFDEEELDNAIKTLEFVLAFYRRVDRSQAISVLAVMKKDEAGQEAPKYSPEKATKKAEIIYH